MATVSRSPRPTARVSATADGASVVLTVDGPLDGAAGAELVSAMADAVATGTARVEIDLCPVARFDADGAAALLECRTLAGALVGGLHYRTQGGGAGQEALLLAYADPHGSG